MMNFRFFLSKSFFCRLILLAGFFSVPMVIGAQENTASFEILLNRERILGESNIKQRDVFIFADDSVFTLSTITKYVQDLSEKFKAPNLLRISIYSDKDMLNKLIKFESQVWSIEFRKDAKGKKSEKEFYDREYPKTCGYYRVTYYRHANSEYFEYSPEKDSPKTIRVDLKREESGSRTLKGFSRHETASAKADG